MQYLELYIVEFTVTRNDRVSRLMIVGIGQQPFNSIDSKVISQFGKVLLSALIDSTRESARCDIYFCCNPI